MSTANENLKPTTPLPRLRAIYSGFMDVKRELDEIEERLRAFAALIGGYNPSPLKNQPSESQAVNSDLASVLEDLSLDLRLQVESMKATSSYLLSLIE